MKRWIAMLLTVCMLISLCPVGVFAEPATGGTEPTQNVQTEQGATGATGTEKPAGSTTETKAAEPTNPTTETKATEPTNPTEETKATEPTNPTEETRATEPTDPTEVTKAAESTDPTEETTKPTEATDATEETEASEPSDEEAENAKRSDDPADCICERFCKQGNPNAECPYCKDREDLTECKGEIEEAVEPTEEVEVPEQIDLEVSIQVTNLDGGEIELGSNLRLTALVANGEGLELNYLWQYSTDGENWEEIDCATQNYDFVLDETNNTYYWQAIVIAGNGGAALMSLDGESGDNGTTFYSGSASIAPLAASNNGRVDFYLSNGTWVAGYEGVKGKSAANVLESAVAAANARLTANRTVVKGWSTSRNGAATNNITYGPKNDSNKYYAVTGYYEGNVEAQFFYMLNPLGNLNDNTGSERWVSMGNASISLANAEWTGINAFNVSGANVLSWPGGYPVITKETDEWNTIFAAFKQKVSTDYGFEVSAEDVVQIRVEPYKISYNGSQSVPYHLDCRVVVECRTAVTATYYIQDAGSNTYVTAKQQVLTPGSATFAPEYPLTKTVKGETYYFDGWYIGQIGGQKASFGENGYTLRTDTTFYARYVKETAQFTVHHYLKDTTESLAESETGTAKVGSSIVRRPLTTITGYTPVSNSQQWLAITNNPEDNVIIFYYEKDDGQTQDTKYTVKCTIEGVEQTADGFEVTGTAWINDDPAQIAIAEGGIPAPADKYRGYKLDESNPTYPEAGTLVNSGSVYTVNYVKDDSKTQDTKYTVKYTINGVEQTADGFEVTGTAWVNDDPAQIAIAEGGIPAPADKYRGYKLDESNPAYPEAGTLVNSGSVYTVNYVKRTDLTYTVKYLWTDGMGSGTAIEGVQDKVVKNVTFGDEIVEGPIDIVGYTPVETGKMEFRMETETREIVFLYYKNVTLTAASDTVTYNGTTQTLSGYTSSDMDAVFTGVSASGSGKDVGEYAVTFNGVSEKEQTISEDGRYLLTDLVDGKLTINPATINIKTNSNSKTYDGTALTADGSINGLVNGETVDFTITGSQTNVGESTNTYSLTWGTAKESNYTVAEDLGKLTVNAVTAEVVVKIKGHSDSKIYNGKEQSVSGYDVESISNALYSSDNIKFTGSASASGTDANTYGMGLGAANFENTNKNFTNVVFEVEDGKLTITPATVTVKTNSNSKTYDGTALTADGSINGLVNGETVDFTVTGSQTNVGESINTYSLTWGKTNSSNYTVVEELGTLTVTEQTINPDDPEIPETYLGVEADSPADLVYDGVEHKWAPTVTDKDGNALTVDVDYTVSYGKTDFTNVTGDIIVTIQGIGNYTGTLTRSYKITPREAVITVNNGTKTVGQNDPAFTGTVTGLVNENDLGTVTYVRTNNAEAVGTYADVLTARYTENGNYDVRVINGTFTITAANNPAPNPPQPNPPQPNPPQPNPPQPQPQPEPEVEPEAAPEVTPEAEPAAPDAGPVEEIVDEETPLAMGGAWALVNLILTVLTVLGSILLLIGYIGKKQKERQDEDGNVILNAEGEAEMDDIKKKGGWRLSSIIPAVAAVIAFILTENMRLPMVLVDKWTLLMVIIALVQLLVAYFSKKKTQEPEQPEQMVANA